ncbi:hypothetical protein SAMN05421504_109166 [Amycolatopsis xylanica]|uniref:Uncharacterized protein n=1 Tax=Amycolatopsis xylanica TaxID=589385 RepID=A0A1H3Q8C8_9PSEU|nr:hypothetical protein [Amycolatopsis xylanica]SDZ09513.1 hypothetical protein SAMN05421504_109166 [Amycolatopsis xylanica]
MRLAGKTWRTVVSTVRLGRDEYRVIRPARPIPHAPLYEGRLGAQLTIDKAASAELAIAWWLAARSPHTLIYLPLRESPSCCGEEYGGRKLDLVLLHHSLGFPVSRWKRVRARLGAGSPQTVRMPEQALPQFDRETHSRRYHRDFRDHLRWDITADTLFLTGSRHAFELEAEQVRTLAEECPAHLAASPGTHCCAEIGMGAYLRRGRDYAELHVEHCQAHRPVSPFKHA